MINQQIRFVDSEEDLDVIALLHKNPGDKDLKIGLFRFYRDKVKLFLEFDPQSILIRNGKNNDIAGFLIYTHDTDKFNAFTGISGWRFYKHICKTASGYYGYDFKKYLKVFRTIIGMNASKFTNSVSEIHPYAKIWALVVSPDYRRMGIASELIKSCLTLYKGKILRITVKKDNLPAVNAYKKNGFKIIGDCDESTGESYIMEIVA